MKRYLRPSWLVLLGMPLALAGCGGDQNILQTTNQHAGPFLSGVWDGLWAIVSFLAEVFGSNRWGIYDVHANSGLYDAGWIIGFLISLAIIRGFWWGVVVIWP